jgi:5-methylcytosine-specific restriction endonuclease McrBC GTP-binding regulatory subunit McrB
MSSARFWFVPLKDLAPAGERAQVAARDEVRASDLPTAYNVPSKLFQEGIRAGHVLALHDGDNVVALARMLALESKGALHWRRLPLLEGPELSATPELREVSLAEAKKFKLGIDAILRDVPISSVSTVEPSPPAKIYTPTGPAANIILYGPPGTGKTHSVRRRALELIGDANAQTAPRSEVNAQWEQLLRNGQIVFSTFHQAFAYEEFVEGLRARTEDGEVHYEVAAGIFKRLALTAAAEGLSDKSTGKPGATVDAYERSRRALAAGQPFAFSAGCRHFVLVIDEINRANIARVFGELITLLEADKRLGTSNELRVQLPASKEWFGVPPNLHVLGTMNTADRSIALMDVALRRRFTFEEMMPDASVLKGTLAEAGVEEVFRTLVVGVFTKLNERLRFLYDREHQVGHAYFLGVRSLADLRTAFADRILPLLQEYFFGQWEKVALALGYPINADGTPKVLRDAQHDVGTFLITQKLDEKSVLGFNHDEYVDQVAWDVHPAFRPGGKANDVWLKQAFDELLGAKKG